MFTSAVNPYDEIITKATDENLASEDWDVNLQVCEKVDADGQTGARNAVNAMQKRLAHRNPNVQLYTLELANTLAQNCGTPLLQELSSRPWTAALDRLINDRATVQPVKKQALTYIKAWAKQFDELNDPNLGIMGEFYDGLRAKNVQFDEPEPTPESVVDARRRQEEEELARVLELSKADQGGRGASKPAANGSSSSASYAPAPAAMQYGAQPYVAPAAAPAPAPEPEQEVDINTATRVRAIYTFTSAEVGELNFERGDVIKVLDRGFKEWWRGACGGKIGIFPVTYVEALPELSPADLQEEAQEEARVFASLGLVDQLLQTLKSIDPSRGDRLDNRPELDEMYQASVGLQGQINALIKKYSDQKAELEYMNANFLKAMKQYEALRNPPQQYYQEYPQYAAQQQQTYPPQPYPAQPQQQPFPSQQHAQQGYPAHPYPAQFPVTQAAPAPLASPSAHQPSPSPGQPDPAPGQYFHGAGAGSTTSLHRAPTGAPSFPPHSPPHRQTTEPGAAGIGAGLSPEEEHRRAWEEYYRAQGYQPGQMPPIPGLEGQAQAQAQAQPPLPQQQQQHQAEPYPPQPYPAPQHEQPPYAPQQQYAPTAYLGQDRPATNAGQPGVDQVAAAVGRMSVGQ
ncbi:ESCRT-0 subunit protein hse1 [Cryptotrichosporon argae]